MPLPRRFYNFFNRTVLRLPAKLCFYFGRTCHQNGWVAAAASFFGYGKINAGYFFGSFNNFTHAEAFFAAKIVNSAFAAVYQMLKRQYMGSSQIFHMNVIAQAGSVRSRVVRAENIATLSRTPWAVFKISGIKCVSG